MPVKDAVEPHSKVTSPAASDGNNEMSGGKCK